MINPTPTLYTLNYSNSQFELNKRKVPNSFLLKEYPDFAVNPNVALIHYKQTGTDNVIKYKDGKGEKLSPDESKYNEFILRFQEFYVDYKDTQLKKKQELSLSIINDLSLNLTNLFKEGVTSKEQTEFIERVNSQPHVTAITDTSLLEFLRDTKIELLKESDFTQLPDVQANYTEEEKAAWIKYRAALRKLDKTNDPLSVRLPEPPESIS